MGKRSGVFTELKRTTVDVFDFSIGQIFTRFLCGYGSYEAMWEGGEGGKLKRSTFSKTYTS